MKNEGSYVYSKKEKGIVWCLIFPFIVHELDWVGPLGICYLTMTTTQKITHGQ